MDFAAFSMALIESFSCGIYSSWFNIEINFIRILSTITFSSSSEEQEELEKDEHFNQIVNEWTPENGFPSPELKRNTNSTPRAGVGSCERSNVFFFYYQYAIFFIKLFLMNLNRLRK